MRGCFALVLLVVVVACCSSSVQAFDIGDTLCVAAGINLRDGPCGAVKWNSNGNERGRLSAVNTPPSCALGKFTWLQIVMADQGPVVWVAKEINMTHECGPKGAVKVFPDVPYINQRFDVGDNFDGSWACGPTSALMAVAGLKKVAAHNISSSQPWGHSNAFGYYDSAVYTSATGFTFDHTQPDPKGRAFGGAWGACTKQGGAWADLTAAYVTHHGGISAVFHDSTTPDLIKTSINAGKMVIQSTQIRGAGHLVLVHGYMPDGRFVVNDPWGDANGPNWGRYPNGEKVLYTWTLLAAKWCIVVGRTAADEKIMPQAIPSDVWTDTRRTYKEE